MRFVAWNVEGRLSRFAGKGERGSPEHILASIERLSGDIVVLPEASDGNNIDDEVERRLLELGYESFATFYDDSGDRHYKAMDEPTMRLLSRVEVVDAKEIRPGDIRTMLMADVKDKETGLVLRVVGIHIDDRSEEFRLRQIEGLLPYINQSPYPVVALGDFNAMYAGSLAARTLRNGMVRWLIDHFPHARTKDSLRRLSQMAIGETMGRIEQETELKHADIKMRPTMTPKMRGQEWMPSIPLVQIDHMLVSPQLNVGDFGVAGDGGSDHRAISAEIGITGQKS